MATRSFSKAEPREKVVAEKGDTITTAVHLPKTTWNLLRAVAFHRAQIDGGRASVSKLVAELAEASRVKFEREIKNNG